MQESKMTATFEMDTNFFPFPETCKKPTQVRTAFWLVAFAPDCCKDSSQGVPGQQTGVTKQGQESIVTTICQDSNKELLNRARTAARTHLMVPGLQPGVTTWYNNSSLGARTTAKSYAIVPGKQQRIKMCVKG